MKRIYVLSTKKGHVDCIIGGLQVALLNNVIKSGDVEVKVQREPSDESIPLDYDIYFIHVSDVRIEQVQELRRARKTAKIYGLTPGENVDNAFDGTNSAMGGDELIRILNQK